MPLYPLLRHAGLGCRTTGLVVLLLASASAATAQGFRVESLGRTGPILVQATVSSEETVRLLLALAKIESDLQLGLLFLTDGLVNPEGSHFTHPRAETYPGIKDALAAAGIADFEPQLAALEAGGDKDDLMAAYTAAVTAVMQARSTLRPSDRDMLLSIVEQARAVAGEINPAGPTEVNNYQDGWAMLMVARNQIDLLVRSKDANVAKAASQMALTFDDVILSMPDPAAGGPVPFDPAPILSAVSELEALAGSV